MPQSNTDMATWHGGGSVCRFFLTSISEKQESIGMTRPNAKGLIKFAPTMPTMITHEQPSRQHLGITCTETHQYPLSHAPHDETAPITKRQQPCQNNKPPHPLGCGGMCRSRSSVEQWRATSAGAKAEVCNTSVLLRNNNFLARPKHPF